VDRLDRRITHLLDFARPASLHLTSEKVSTLVDDVLPAFAERARSQRIAVDVYIPPTLPAVRMDSLRTEQALVEVLSNAVDAMPAGGTISITHPPMARVRRCRRGFDTGAQPTLDQLVGAVLLDPAGRDWSRRRHREAFRRAGWRQAGNLQHPT
jgi:hypothetical protein